ncbi:MAG TPA: asparagine synthase (glutamine-hydrolyzing) [Candidatus Saccharimonadales bacterium]|jgi:asparagine synthase (glutamine-hydrolysing)|nr:asparagine synthase (glutamine-hydrolyzing) [Candidatus Saccharimonadales bacterium]
MCGISGILDLANSHPSVQDLEAMTTVLRHRGPDDRGRLVSGPLKMGFRRLSIVDVAGGRQPMSNEDGNLWIVFNGEIYNHLELRPALEQRGHRYATNSDTETILHLYEEYGEDCVHHLRGMFAFAIWDDVSKRLFCARDRLGIKPFYYAITGGQFVFASEIKALFEVPGLKPQLNRRALPEFLALGYLSDEETMFQGVYKLLPGHHLLIDRERCGSRPRPKRYWDLDFTPPQRVFEEADYVAQFEELFTESVRIHMRSDVPLGVFLSGGLDSSSIAAITASLSGNPVQTFSVGYDEDQYSELPYARQVAEHIGSEHHEVVLGPEEFFASLAPSIWHEDEPLVWPSSVALYHVARLASEKVKVVLSGEGADEIMAGYPKYLITLWNLRGGPAYRKYAPQFLQQLACNMLASNALPDWLRRKLRHSFLYHPDKFESIYFDNFYSVFPQDQQPQMLSQELAEELREANAYANSMRFFSPDGNDNLLNRLLYLDIKTYLVELLMKQDQMSMAASVESRVPFLDHKLVEFLAQTPEKYKIRHLSGKHLMRRAMARRLPDAVLRRSKKGFPTPIRPWLRNQLFDRVHAMLTDGRLAGRGLIRPGYIERLLRAHRDGHSDATEGCWRLLNFELWCRIFMDGEAEYLDIPASGVQNAALCA